MADEEYEILPHKLLSDLKYDVEALKKKLTQPDAKINELILEIESLKDSVHDLNNIFTKALDETKEDDIYVKINNLDEKLNDVIAQNETIAKGMLAISDKLEDFIGKGNTNEDMAAPVKHSMGVPPPSSFGPSRTAPMPNVNEPQKPNFPPPPPSFNPGDRKKFGELFK